jgi:vesicle coat complex subunit
MANRNNSTARVSTQPKPFSKAVIDALMRNENFARLQKFMDISSTPIKTLVDEALNDYIQCTVKARAELMLRDAQRLERAQAKVEEKRHVDEYLSKLEIDLNR